MMASLDATGPRCRGPRALADRARPRGGAGARESPGVMPGLWYVGALGASGAHAPGTTSAAPSGGDLPLDLAISSSIDDSIRREMSLLPAILRTGWAESHIPATWVNGTPNAPTFVVVSPNAIRSSVRSSEPSNHAQQLGRTVAAVHPEGCGLFIQQRANPASKLSPAESVNRGDRSTSLVLAPRLSPGVLVEFDLELALPQGPAIRFVRHSETSGA